MVEFYPWQYPLLYRRDRPRIPLQRQPSVLQIHLSHYRIPEAGKLFFAFFPNFFRDVSNTRKTHEKNQLLDRHDALDEHGRFRDILIGAVAAGGYALDAVHDVLPLNDLAEHGIAPAAGSGGGVIQEIIVGYVDEELTRSRVRIVGARRRDRVLVGLEAVVGFVFNRSLGFLLLQTGFNAAALTHEAADDAVENRAVVKTRANVLQKIFTGLRCSCFIEFDVKDALVGRKANHD